MRALTTALMAAGVVALGLAVAVVGRNVAPGAGRQDTTAKREVFGPPLPADFAQREASLARYRRSGAAGRTGHGGAASGRHRRRWSVPPRAIR